MGRSRFISRFPLHCVCFGVCFWFFWGGEGKWGGGAHYDTVFCSPHTKNLCPYIMYPVDVAMLWFSAQDLCLKVCRWEVHLLIGDKACQLWHHIFFLSYCCIYILHFLKYLWSEVSFLAVSVAMLKTIPSQIVNMFVVICRVSYWKFVLAKSI